MKVYSGSEIRNVAVVGHNDTGKTTLVSQLLFDAGATTRLGRIEDGTTTTDFDPDEIERKHSISAAFAHVEWKNTKINLLDTPGFGIFMMEAKSALRVADSAAIVVSGVTGVEVSTERVWKFAEEFGLARIVIVNKMDRERASASRTLDALQKKFGKNVVPIQMPMGEEHDFSGVIDLVSMKALKYAADGSGKFDAIDIPAEHKAAADEWREKLIEKVAEGDDTLMERFFEQGGLSQEELLDGLKREVAHHQIFPVLYASASHNIAGHSLLDAFVNLLPSPEEVKTLDGIDRKGEKLVFDRRPEAFPAALVFKTFSDPFSGRIALFRVYSGTLKSDTAYWNTTKDHEERIGKLQVLQGKQQIPVSELKAGDIGAVAKLKDTHTGDTIAAKDHQIQIPSVQYPEAAIAFAVEPKARAMRTNSAQRSRASSKKIRRSASRAIRKRKSSSSQVRDSCTSRSSSPSCTRNMESTSSFIRRRSPIARRLRSRQMHTAGTRSSQAGMGSSRIARSPSSRCRAVQTSNSSMRFSAARFLASTSPRSRRGFRTHGRKASSPGFRWSTSACA